MPGSRTCAASACRDPASRSRRCRGRSTRRATDSSSARAPGRCSSRTSSYAKARGARIYAEVVGYGSAADGWDMIQPVDKGTGSARAMKMALERRGVPADEVDLINPHGTSTPLGDKREAEAIWTVFGDHAARPIAICAHEVDDRPHDGRRGRVRGVRDGHGRRRAVHPADAQLPRLRSRVRPVGRHRGDAPPDPYALSNNIGLGGHNGAIIFKRYDGD